MAVTGARCFKCFVFWSGDISLSKIKLFEKISTRSASQFQNFKTRLISVKTYHYSFINIKRLLKQKSVTKFIGDQILYALSYRNDSKCKCVRTFRGAFEKRTNSRMKIRLVNYFKLKSDQFFYKKKD